MTDTKIIAITILAVFAVGLGASEVLAQGASNAKAIPDWVDNNFRWYGEGLIEQSDLLNSLSYMLDNGFMHLSDKAAQEMKELRQENIKLRSMMDDTGHHGEEIHPDEYGRAKTQFSFDAEQIDALHHLRKAFDLNSNLQTKVVQYDKDHDKWIDVDVF